MEAIDIDKLEAGRELDAEIAEDVMGLDLYAIWDYDEDAGGNIFATGVRSDLPHYSTDIAAAWQVVEKLIDAMNDGWGEGLQYPVILPSASQTVVSFAMFDGDEFESCMYPEYGRDLRATAAADTTALAICRAALKAVMAILLAIQPSQTP